MLQQPPAPVGYKDGSHKPDIICQRFDDPLKLRALDLTIVHPTSATALRDYHSDTKPGATIEHSEGVKRKHYQQFHLQQDLTLTTLAFETYGRESPATSAFIRACCIQATGLETGWQHHPISRRWRTRIHAAIQVGNAALIRV